MTRPSGSAGLFSSVARPGDELKSDRVVAELERRILRGELEPGTRLPTESELCEMLGVSRSVVRDAVRTLVARGLVVVRQGHGTTVAEPSDAAFGQALLVLLARSGLTMGDVVTARATLETALVRQAAVTGTADDWDRLEEDLASFAAAVEASDWDRARDAHVAFHVGVLRALHQPALELFLKPMTEIIMISGAPPRRGVRADWEVPTHRPILDALIAGDPDAAGAAMASHFGAMREPERYGDFRAQPFRGVFDALPGGGRPSGSAG